MYDLYVKHCEDNSITDAVKMHKYREVFNHNFNIEFQKPKKDKSDICMEAENNKKRKENMMYMKNHVKIHMRNVKVILK